MKFIISERICIVKRQYNVNNLYDIKLNNNGKIYI